jgi:hypothetical protein
MSTDEFISLTVQSLRENGATPELIEKTVSDLKKAKAEEAAEKANAPKQKNKTQFVVLVSKPAPGQVAGKDQVGWVMQIEESASPAVAFDRVVAAANAFNGSKKGKRVPVKTIGETLENVPAKFYKEPGKVTRVKTRTPVLVQEIAFNELPKN